MGPSPVPGNVTLPTEKIVGVIETEIGAGVGDAPTNEALIATAPPGANLPLKSTA